MKLPAIEIRMDAEIWCYDCKEDYATCDCNPLPDEE